MTGIKFKTYWKVHIGGGPICSLCLLPETNCLSVFDHFVGLALKGLRMLINENEYTFFSL